MVTETVPGATTTAPLPSQADQSSVMAPMGMPPAQDGPSSRGEPPNGAKPGYHPQSGPPPSGYPPSTNPYQVAQQSSYPPPGNFPPQNFPPYGYPPMYSGSFGGGQAPFFGGFPGGGGYPTQQQSRSPHPDKSDKSSAATAGGRKNANAPARRNGTSNKSSPRKSTQPLLHPPPGSLPMRKSIHDLEVERHAAAPADFTANVAPMRSAFHFFVDDTKETLRQLAIDEVKQSTNNDKVDLYLVNTNLNSRLIKEWEDADESLRESYMEKEEADRKRFMTEDEIASRHCATLTARARSPKFGTSGGSSISSLNKGVQKRAEDDSLSSGTRDSPSENGESPTKKSRKEVKVNGKKK